jgi:uncharacterized membrane protein HdeD (DUF308 family)
MGVLLRGPCIAMSTAWKRWQDWGSVVIGVLFFITPFVFGATTNSAAAYTAYVGGVLLVIAGLWNLATPDNQAVEWAELVLGVLIFLAPWVLGFAGLATIAWSAWVAGVLAVMLSGSVLYSARRTSALASHA